MYVAIDGNLEVDRVPNLISKNYSNFCFSKKKPYSFKKGH